MELSLNGVFGNSAFETDLNDAVDVGKCVGLLRGEEDEEHVGWSIGEELQIIGRVFVMRRDVERPDALKKSLGKFVITEKRVSIDEEELTIVGMRRARKQSIGCGSAVQTEKRVQPSLHRIVHSISNRFGEFDFTE